MALVGPDSPQQQGRAASAQDGTLRQHLPWRAVALLLPGGGSERAVDGLNRPAVYFGGKFRVVDFALSNCINSGIRRIGVITPHKSHSLERYLQRGWAGMKTSANEFVELLPFAPRKDADHGVCGTADAVLQNQAVIDSANAEYVLVIRGSHIYKMNYALMLADHVAKGRECTVACIERLPGTAPAFAAMQVNEQWQITAFADPAVESGGEGRAWASMGIYIFNAKFLSAALARDRADAGSGHDFDRDIVSHAVRSGNAAAHAFPSSCVGGAPGAEPYWRDVGTIDAYWGAHIELTAAQPLLNLYDSRWPIWTHEAPLAPAKFLHNQPERRGMAIDSLVSCGSIVSGEVLHSVLFSSVRVHSCASVEWSVLLPGVDVGCAARLRRVLVERDCRIPDGLVIGEDAQADAERFLRTDSGITLVTAAMLARLPSLAGGSR